MFLGQIEKMDWQMECDVSVPYRAMTVQVGFSHAENEMDETEFCINAYDAKELTELFEGFCKENGFKDVSVESISVVRVAATLDELTKMEEMEAYQKEDSVVSKEIADMDLVQKWKDIYSKEDQTMIALLECEEARELSKADKEELLLWSGDDEYAYVDEKGTLVYKERNVDIENYFDSVNLEDYDLGGCEITDDDFQVIAEKMRNTGDRLEVVVDEYLKGIREVLDEGLEEELDYEEAFSGNEKKSLEEIIAGVEEKQEKGPRKAVKEIGREEMRL